ncbi:MAG: phosphatidylserine decarboxylase family protein [Verrucomicrobiota bacterium]
MSPAFQESLKVQIPFFIGLGISIMLPYSWGSALAIFFFLLIVFSVYFFRDPQRSMSSDENIIVSPADGKIVNVDEVDSPCGLGKRKRIAIFLSVFDVHVNRMPTTGTVEIIEYHPGKFLDVRDPQASLLNEHTNWKIQTPHGPLVVRQIAGLVARRIVPWAPVGKNVSRGELIGMIRFGSRTEIFLPLDCEILVKEGDYAHGISTSLAKWKV